MQFENRFTAGLEEDAGRMVGYAAVWHSLSHDLGGFREIIAPGAFDRTLRENPDVFALAEHDPMRILGRTTNGTLRIQPDERGLRVELLPADTSYARDLLALVKRGDVAGMSFRFRPYPGGASMDLKASPLPLRTLTSVELREVSIVSTPAYPDTSIGVRDLEAARAASVRLAHQKMRLDLAAR